MVDHIRSLSERSLVLLQRDRNVALCGALVIDAQGQGALQLLCAVRDIEHPGQRLAGAIRTEANVSNLPRVRARPALETWVMEPLLVTVNTM